MWSVYVAGGKAGDNVGGVVVGGIDNDVDERDMTIEVKADSAEEHVATWRSHGTIRLFAIDTTKTFVSSRLTSVHSSGRGDGRGSQGVNEHHDEARESEEDYFKLQS